VGHSDLRARALEIGARVEPAQQVFRRGKTNARPQAGRLNVTTLSPAPPLAMPHPRVHKLASPRRRVRSPVSLFSLVANVRADLEAIGQAAAGGRILTGASGLGLRAFVHVLNSPNFTIGTHVALCLH